MYVSWIRLDYILHFTSFLLKNVSLKRSGKTPRGDCLITSLWMCLPNVDELLDWLGRTVDAAVVAAGDLPGAVQAAVHEVAVAVDQRLTGQVAKFSYLNHTLFTEGERGAGKKDLFI